MEAEMNNDTYRRSIKSRIAAVLGIAALILMMLPVSLGGSFAADNTMMTDRFDVTVDVPGL